MKKPGVLRPEEEEKNQENMKQRKNEKRLEIERKKD